MTDVELLYTEDMPLVLGHDDGKGKGQMVIATGYGYGFRLGQAGYVRGDLVQEALDSHLLVPYDASSAEEGSHPGVPAGQEPGTMRRADYVAEMGIKPALGTTQADTRALLADHETVFEPAGPTSIADEQSDRRTAEHRRTVDESTAGQNLVDAQEDMAAGMKDLDADKPKLSEPPDLSPTVGDDAKARAEAKAATPKAEQPAAPKPAGHRAK